MFFRAKPVDISELTPTYSIPDKSHPLRKLAEIIDWEALASLAKQARGRRRGPQPAYRQLLGAMVLMATKDMAFREAADYANNYIPARYLCGLKAVETGPNYVSIFEFTQMLGAQGIARINEEILRSAKSLGIADPKTLMSDTTAQEARIPYPNEIGLMNRFMALAHRQVGRLRGGFDKIKKKVKKAAAKTKGLLRNAHLFAKGREQKRKIGRKMYHTVKKIQEKIATVINSGANVTSKAGQQLSQLNEVMGRLLPQIKFFHKTGFVAAGKIIHLQMPELYAIVRGKAGKTVEFGLKWGINRIGGGFLSGFLMADAKPRSDIGFCKESLNQHQAIFGAAPEVFGFDRGGYSGGTVKAAKRMGIKHIGIAPKGKSDWHVGPRMQDRIRKERAQIEGSIGAVKSRRYGFNKPQAHSRAAMERCGQRAILGFNLTKMVTMHPAWAAAT